MLIEAARVGDIAPGGMKSVKVGADEVVLCNCDGVYYAVDKCCGHMNAPLELGALDGTILTCPMHHVQFDVTTGEALNHPISAHRDAPLPSDESESRQHPPSLPRPVHISNIRTFPVQVADGVIMVDVG